MNKINIGLCFLNIGEKYKQITYWSRQNKISYCNYHGYDFIEDESVYNKNKPIPWTKIPLLLKYINNYDYIVWIDADILIMNKNIKIEDFINLYSHSDIICGSDWRMINTGVMIIKCSDFSKEFIASIETNVYDPNEDKNERYLNWEQGSFINLYDKNFMDCVNHIVVTTSTDMNSYWFNYFPGHFVLHFAGVRGELLQYLIRDYYPERLDSDSDESYNSRMEWLAGPVREHLDNKLKNEKENEVKHLYAYRAMLDQFKIYHYDIWKKIRLGNNYDGGHVIPDLPYSKLYSFGISYNMAFDKNFVEKYKNSTAYVFDNTRNNLPSYDYSKIYFSKTALGKQNEIDGDIKTLNDIVLNETENTMLLKIDIEGGEFDSLLNATDETLNKFMCIVVEFHWLTNDDDKKRKIECFKKLNNLFYIIHAHANNHSPVIVKEDFYHVPDVIEFTFIRKDLMDGEIVISRDQFPTKLDFPNHGLIPEIPLTFYPYCKYYFSLTTIPSRIDKLEDVVNSLVHQTIKPIKIFIHIPKFYKRFNCCIDESRMVDIIENYKQKFNDIVEFNICDNDYGPATKFIPMMKMNNIDDNIPIIILDDDIVYDKNLSAILLKDSYRYPDSCVTAFGITHSAYLFDNAKWYCDFNSQFLKPCGFRDKREGFIDVFEAFKGTLLKKKLFKDDLSYFPEDEYCFADDVWFSGHIIKNGFNIFMSKYDLKTKYIQDDVDALSANLDIRNKRMKGVATYFHKTYGIWRFDA
jgi:hypothetical protein